MSVTVTPADRAAAHDKIAATNIAVALKVADKVLATKEYDDATIHAGRACRLLLLGTLTDTTMPFRTARVHARQVLRDLCHDDSHSKGARTVYRRCLDGLDGKLG